MVEKSALIKSVQNLKAIIPKMKSLQIPITPQNYTVWYAFLSGDNEDLKTSINELLERGSDFTEEINESLYINYVGDNSSSELLSNVQSETERLLFQLLSELEGVRKDTQHFSEALGDTSKRLEQTITKEDLVCLVSVLMAELEEVNRSHLKMESALKSTTNQVVGLRLEMTKLHGAAMVDSLTGIFNRRAFDETITDLTNRSGSGDFVFSLLMVDIDHFKKFNDTHGHLAGDKVLVYVATLLKNGVKGSDTVARYGGEEFAVLLPETSRANAIAVAEDLCKKINSKVLTAGNGNQLGRITVSIGVSSSCADRSREDIIERADKALYSAKESGRNRVVSEEQLEVSHSD